MRVIYMGTPAYAVTPLTALLEGGHSVVGVVTQPDRPAGRGRGLMPPPVKVYAESQGLRVLQPATLRDAIAQAEIIALEPEVVVIAAYGLILPRAVVEAPPLGCVNLHPSLLPRHRGPSPVAFTILEGDEIGGVSLMLLDRGTDSGPVLAQEERPSMPEDTTGALTDELFSRGADLLARVLPAYGRGEVTPVPQDGSRATYARKLTKEDGAIRWELSAAELWRQVRAFTPWPGSYTRWRGGLLKVVEAVPIPELVTSAPGSVLRLPSDGPAPVGVATGDGVLGLVRVQPEGRRVMEAAEFMRGYGDFAGTTLTDVS
ncbi:MAG: methionyl-tRNA formyltransferase [Chloroflexota bacterium]|nr:methionyl-tRNA formyltransferase [Chloroflexota bacterium]MDE2942195.1 methionyl-tRNA formyltransferase [Chloroflexota bacterium]MDE3267504.1 methionyl-tRNA formyltransferase [Chloroflexota bacterium]